MVETIKTAVCDDEKNIRFHLILLIKKQGGECSITEYTSTQAGHRKILQMEQVL